MTERIEGYAALFDSEAVIASQWREKLAPGCFARTLRNNPDVVMLLDHDSGRVLGRTSAGSLTLREDGVGLWFSLLPDPTTPEGQTAIGTVRRGDVRGCSFGFQVRAETWRDGDRRLPLRIIEDVDLFEITATAFPAYPATTAALVRRGVSQSAQRAEAAMRVRGLL